MDFGQIITELTQNDEAQEALPTYHQNASQLQMLSTSKAGFISSVIPEASQNLKLPTALGNLDAILGSCMLLYHFSIQQDDELLSLFKLLAQLSKLLLQQTIQQLPTTVYASICSCFKRYLELLTKDQQESTLINQLANNINIDSAFDRNEASKLLSTLARDLLIDFDQMLSETATVKFVQFIAEQKEFYKLVDIISLSKFTTKFTKSEQYIAELSYENLMNVYEIQDEDEECLALIQYWLQQLSTTTINLQQVSLEKFFVPFVNKYFKQIEFIISGLLVNKPQFKQLGLLLFQQVVYLAIDGKFKNFGINKFLYIIEVVILQIMESDDQYLSTLQRIVNEILQSNKSDKELFRNLPFISQLNEWQSNNQMSPNTNMTTPQVNLQLSRSPGMTTQSPGINSISMLSQLNQLQPIQQRAAYMYLVIYYTVAPLVLYVSLRKLSTHNELVNNNIYVRRGCCEFYGVILSDKSVLDTLLVLIGIGEGQKSSHTLLQAARAHTQSQQNEDQFYTKEAEEKIVIRQYSQQYLQVYYSFIEKLKFKNKQIAGVLSQIFQKIKHLLGSRTDLKDFLLNELIIRLSDESQQVKKAAIQSILQFIETDYEYVSLIFSEILQVQGQDSLLVKIFEQYVIKPFYGKQAEITTPLLKFFEKCPQHLFESTFAEFVKEREVDLKLIFLLIELDQVGAYNFIFFFLQFGGIKIGSKDLQKIVDRLYVALQEYDVSNNISNTNYEDLELLEKQQQNRQKMVWILNILSIDFILTKLEFNLTRFMGNLQYVDVELQNKVNVSVIFKGMDQLNDLQRDKLIINQHALLLDSLNQFNELRSNSNFTQEKLTQVYANDNGNDQVHAYLDAGNALFSKVSWMILSNVFSENQKKQLFEACKYSVGEHPAACTAVLYAAYQSDDVELRMKVFECLVEALYNQTTNVRLANNLMICALSAVYAFPDELGQYIGNIFDVYAVQNNFLLQRHLLQIVLDLERLSLIKVTPELFGQLFMMLDSPNVDLRSLTERALLQSSQYATHFARYFLVCMQTFIEKQPSASARGAVYGKVMQRLSASDKYTLLNKMLEEIIKRSRTVADEDPFLEDVLAMIAGGVVEIQINDELVKFKTSIKKMNVQYSVQQVLPRLFECLHQFNEKRIERLKDVGILAIRQVCNQMRVSYEELSAQFGDIYNLELMQVK